MLSWTMSELGGSDPTLPGAARPVSATDPTESGSTEPSRGKAGGLEPGDRIGRFEIASRLGAGGMGVVYLAQDPELGRKVAVKLLLGHADGSAGDGDRMRLKREAQAMAQVVHPNLVTVYDVGEHAGNVFIAMEYVSGGTLREWLAAGREPAEILQTFAAAGRGLAAAHAAGIIHRDFKPDNVLVAGDGTVKVLDFGLAAGANEDPATVDPADAATRGREDPMALRLTRTGALLGTPAYMSPEQHHGRVTDARTDQFSFAVSLFEALYGVRPFAGDTMAALVHSVLSGSIVEVPKSSVPPQVDDAIRRALSVDPEDRFSDVNALLGALEPDPVPAPRAGTRRPIIMLTGVGVATVAGVAGALALSDADEPLPAPAPAHDTPDVPADHDPEAAAALMDAILASTDGEKEHHARSYLDTHRVSGGRAREAIAEGLLGAALWRSSCDTDFEGLCLTIGEAPSAEGRCREPSRGPVTMHERNAEQAVQAREHLRRAVETAAAADPPSSPAEARSFEETIAMAQTLLVDAEFETFLGIKVPRNLAFSGDSAHQQLSKDAFSGWWDRVQTELGRLGPRYAAIKDQGSDYWTVTAAARTGLMYEHVSESLYGIPIPSSLRKRENDRVSYCDAVTDFATPIRDQARDAFAWCSRQATRAGLSKGVVDTCDQRINDLAKLDEAQVREVVRSKVPALRACYDTELKDDSTAAGHIETRFNIGSDGKVTDARATQASTVPERMQTCIADVFREMAFPSPGEGQSVAMSYPLDFAPE